MKKYTIEAEKFQSISTSIESDNELDAVQKFKESYPDFEIKYINGKKC